MDAVSLVVPLARPVVADVRRRHEDDLPRVGWIRQYLLISGHGGVEHEFTRGRPRCADGGAAEHLSIRRDQDALPRCRHVSSHVTSPRRIVAWTLPVSSVPR